MSVNDMQVGGSHYKKQYQHWDFVIDTGLHYLLGVATKYPSRWRGKNGVEDLKKSIHCIKKAQEEEIYPSVFRKADTLIHIKRYCSQFPKQEADIIESICLGFYNDALLLLVKLIESETAEGEVL